MSLLTTKEDIFRRIGAEFLATAMFMTIGCMNLIPIDEYVYDTPLNYALNLGLVLHMCVHCFGTISGAYINPNVTITSYMLGTITFEMAFAYTLMQFLGAIAGYFVLLIVFPTAMTHDEMGMCFNYPMDSLNTFQVIGIEFVLTLTYLLFWCSMWDARNQKLDDTMPVRFGLMFGSICLSGARITGPSTNFARSLAPAVFLRRIEFMYMFIIGQLLAVLVAVFLWKRLFMSEQGMEIKHETRGSLWV